MAFVNEIANTNKTNNTVYHNNTSDISYSINTNDLDEQLSQIRHSTDIQEINNIFKDCKNLQMHKLAILYELSMRFDLLDKLDDTLLNIGDYQFLYINCLKYVLDNNLVDNDTTNKLGKLYNKMESVHNTAIIMGVFMNYYESDKHDVLVELYNTFDKDVLTYLLLNIYTTKAELLKKVLDDVINYKLYKCIDYLFCKKIISEVKYDELEDTLKKYELEKEDIRYIIESSLYNKDINVFNYLYKINSEIKHISFQTILHVITNKYYSILDILLVNYTLSTDDKQVILNLLNDITDMEEIRILVKLFKIDVNQKDDLILRKAVISENFELIKYLLENHKFELEATKFKLLKLCTILDNEDISKYINNYYLKKE